MGRLVFMLGGGGEFLCGCVRILLSFLGIVMSEHVSQLPEVGVWGRRVQRVWGWGLWQAVRMTTRMEVSEETKQNFQDLDEDLKDGSTILYAYHWTKADAIWAPLMVRAMAGNLIKAIGPVAREHYEGHQKWWFKLMGTTLGIHGMPVVRDNEDDIEYLNERGDLLEDLKRETKVVLDKEGGTYGVAVNGGRVQVLTTPSNVAFVKIGRDNDKVDYRPYAFFVNDEGRMEASLGESVDKTGWEGMSNEDIVEILMWQLAWILPERVRGEYGGVVSG